MSSKMQTRSRKQDAKNEIDDETDKRLTVYLEKEFTELKSMMSVLTTDVQGLHESVYYAKDDADKNVYMLVCLLILYIVFINWLLSSHL